MNIRMMADSVELRGVVEGNAAWIGGREEMGAQNDGALGAVENNSENTEAFQCATRAPIGTLEDERVLVRERKAKPQAGRDAGRNSTPGEAVPGEESRPAGGATSLMSARRGPVRY